MQYIFFMRSFIPGSFAGYILSLISILLAIHAQIIFYNFKKDRFNTLLNFRFFSSM